MKNMFTLALWVLSFFSIANLAAQTKQGSPKTAYLMVDRNDTILKKVWLVNYVNNLKRIVTEKENSKAVPVDFVIQITTPGFYQIQSFKPIGAPDTVFIQPGDSITFKNDGNRGLIFTGKNAAHYNFFKELFKSVGPYPDYDETAGIDKFLTESATVYKSKLAFLDEYSRTHSTSPLFYKAVKNQIEFYYRGWILNKFTLPGNVIKNNPKLLQGINFTTYSLKKDIPVERSFYWSLGNYVRSYSIIKEPSENYSAAKLRFTINAINKNLSGELREFALTETFDDYETHLKPENISVIKECLTTALATIQDPVYKEELEKKQKKLLQLSAELPQEVLNAQLLDTEGNLVILKDILKNQGTRVKVLDFWASWCGPCIAGIKETHVLREKLTSEQQVAFLYISTDKNPDLWKKKVAELSALGVNKNHYRLTDESYKIFSKLFLIESIPKYVVLTPGNKVYLNTVPAPGSADFENVLQSASK